MNVVTVLWSMLASACWTAAGVYAFVWLKRRALRVNLWFALTAAGTGGIAAFELVMMQAGSVAEFALLLKWFHVPVWLVFVALLAFVRSYLAPGRAWLAWSAVAARTLSLVLDLAHPVNLNYSSIARLVPVPFLGESVSVPEGEPNPAMALGQLALLLLLAFVLDAARSAWKRGERPWSAAAWPCSSRPAWRRPCSSSGAGGTFR